MTQIKIKRGLDSNRSQVTAATGEPLWTTDTHELYVGDGKTAGGIPVGTVKTSGAPAAGTTSIALYKDTTGRVIQPQTKTEFLKDYSTSAQVDAKIKAQVPNIKVKNATHADKATTADQLGGVVAANYVDNTRITNSYTEDSASKVVSAKGIKAMHDYFTSYKSPDSSKLNGHTETASPTPNTILLRDGSGAAVVKDVKTTQTLATTPTAGAGILFRNNSSNDNFLRYCTDMNAFRNFIGALGNSGNVKITGEGDILELTYPAGDHGYLRGTRGATSDWYIGRPSADATYVDFNNYNGNNGVKVFDNGTIHYDSTRNQPHVFNNSANFANNIAVGPQGYASIKLQGKTGSHSLLEYDSASHNLNIIVRDDTGNNRNVWFHQDNGILSSPRGFETQHAYNGGGAFADQQASSAPFYIPILTNQNGNSVYYPAIKWQSKPASGNWLTTSIGHIQGGNNINGTVLTSVDVAGRDLKTWSFDRNGNASSSGKWIDASDARIKENIKDLIPNGTSAMSLVNQFGAKSYNYIDGGSKSYGFIAQEVQKVLPDAVSESYDANIGTRLGLHYGSVTALHHEALKELQAENEALKARLAAIESKLGI